MTPGHVRGETARDILMRTKRLFTSGHWCEGSMHSRVVRDDERIDVYCLVGGLRESSPYPRGYEYQRACQALAKAAYGSTRFDVETLEQDLIFFNDGTAEGSSEKVIELIDKAVELLDTNPDLAPLDQPVRLT